MIIIKYIHIKYNICINYIIEDKVINSSSHFNKYNNIYLNIAVLFTCIFYFQNTPSKQIYHFILFK